MCCLCGDDDKPVKGDKFPDGRAFKTTMCKAPCADPCCCLLSCFCPPCAQITIRKQVLKHDMSKYICCQGMFGGCCCCKPGHLGEQNCPSCCLCLEAFCCLSCAVSASRWYLMGERGLRSDPCDRRIIRINNCIQCLSCICTCIAAITGQCREAAACLRLVADILFCTVQACMTTQVHYEMEEEDAANVVSSQKPAHTAPGPQQDVMY